MTPLAYSIATAVEATALSRSHLNEAIARGDLKARKSSKGKKGSDNEGEPTGKWVILADDLRAYLEKLPEA